MLLDLLHSIVMIGGVALFMVVSAVVFTITYVCACEPLMNRLKWWWRLRNTHIITVSMDRIDISLCDEYRGINDTYTHSFTSDVARWCHYNMAGRHGCAPKYDHEEWIKSFYFEKPEDAFLFKMKWV